MVKKIAEKKTAGKSFKVNYIRRVMLSKTNWELHPMQKWFDNQVEASKFVIDCNAGKFNKGNEVFTSAKTAA